MNPVQALKENPFVLAPMAAITDHPFRSFMRKLGAGVVVSELISATGIEYKNQKIGIEFKFPKRSSKGYSNSTQTRIKSINDIKRLSYLVNKNKIDLGVFLMASNERAYVFTGKKTINPEFETYHSVQYKKGESFPIHQSTSKECIINPIEITFTWNGINETHIINKFAWISPIFIYKNM